MLSSARLSTQLLRLILRKATFAIDATGFNNKTKYSIKKDL